MELSTEASEDSEPAFQFSNSADVFFVHRLALERLHSGDERYRLTEKKLSGIIHELIWSETLDFTTTTTFFGEEHDLIADELAIQQCMRCPGQRDWLHAGLILRSMAIPTNSVQ